MLAAIMIEIELYCELLNLVAHFAGFSVRLADLDDPAECRRIDAFVADHPETELFHRPAWTRGVERVYTWFTDFARPESLAAGGGVEIARDGAAGANLRRADVPAGLCQGERPLAAEWRGDDVVMGCQGAE